MKYIYALVMILMLAAAVGAETISLSRSRSVELALERNESYQSAWLEEKRVSGQYIEARSGALPRLSLTGTYLRNIDLQTSVFTMSDSEGNAETMKISFGTPHNYSMALSLYQPLYAAGQVGAAIKIAGYGKKYTDAAIVQARHEVSTAADRAYLDAVAAAEAARAYRESERLADSNLSVVKKLYEQGQVSEFDLIQAQVRAANTRPDRIAAANRARLALDNLRHMLALPFDTSVVIDSIITRVSVPDVSLNELVNEALLNRPELWQSEQLMKIRDKQITIASSGYRPNVGVSSTVQWDSFKDKFNKVSLASDSWNRSWNVAVVLQWPIFSGFETMGKVRQAKVDFDQSRLANTQLTRQIRLEVQDALGKAKEAGERVDALEEAVGQAVRGVEIARVRFHNGIGIQLELLDAQVALTTARVNRISALHDLAVAVSGLRRAVGREWAPQW